MNERYKEYSRAIQEELEKIEDLESENVKPMKKGLTLCQKLLLSLYFLKIKPSK
jgi:hypothetical protein